MDDKMKFPSKFFVKPPPIITPIFRRVSVNESLQWHPRCSDFEKRLVYCYESYGFLNPKCKDYLADLNECIYTQKSSMRVTVMREERHMQYEEGTRKELYAPSPPHNVL